ncbi:MAG: hypothetical protein LUF85_09920 [Bacteroides sp.]|nr:hypothetical protein [Bacteroides sp.]
MPNFEKFPVEEHTSNPCVATIPQPQVSNPALQFPARHLTICKGKSSFDKERKKQITLPKLYVQGKWMYNAGFLPGHILDVTVEYQQIHLKVIGKVEGFPFQEYRINWFEDHV